MRSVILSTCSLTLVISLAACGGGGGGGGPTTAQIQTAFAFVNSLDQSVLTNVSTNGQSSRKVNIEEIDIMLLRLTNDINIAAKTSGSMAILTELVKRYEDTGDNRTQALLIANSVSLPFVQASLSIFSASAKSLMGKTAGNDSSTDHKVWATPGNFKGWSDATIIINGGGIDTPEKLIRTFFANIQQRAEQHEAMNFPLDPDGNAITEVTLTAEGRDLRQLTEKFLRMAINYSQVTDDYLDTDMTQPTKGLLADNSMLSGTNPYTNAEHQWDEGWGYFGAARDYRLYTDEEIAKKGGRSNYQGAFDSNNDGMIDLDKEFNIYNAVNAAKRDLGSNPAAKTDFTAAIFDGLVNGRKIITAAVGRSYSSQEFMDLEAQRNIVVNNWEKVIAATIVHYINDVINDMNNESGSAYFVDISKHWSEMKGFALGLQFNPRKQISQSNFELLHTLIGDKPVLKNDSIMNKDNYKAALIQARTILASAYNFDSANLGDVAGLGGW